MNKTVTHTYVKVKTDDEYFERLKAYYALPLYKRLFRKVPK